MGHFNVIPQIRTEIESLESDGKLKILRIEKSSDLFLPVYRWGRKTEAHLSYFRGIPSRITRF